MPWNYIKERDWATNPKRRNEAGHVDQVQGTEFDYVGVIVGEDTRLKDGEIEYNIIKYFELRVKTFLIYCYNYSDGSYYVRKEEMNSLTEKMNSLTEKMNSIPFIINNRFVKDTLWTLMTRSKKGCYIYFEDEKINLEGWNKDERIHKRRSYGKIYKRNSN